MSMLLLLMMKRYSVFVIVQLVESCGHSKSSIESEEIICFS